MTSNKIGPFLLGLSLAGAYIVGCATSSFVQPPASAQPAPGTQAHAGGWTECVFFQTPDWSHANNPEHTANPVGRFRVPPGWTPIGGAGDPRYALFCR